MTSWDLRCGRHQEVLADVVEVDCLIADPPYSERTHVGRRTGSEIRQSGIQYDPMTEDKAHELASFWAPRVRYWVVIFCDHVARQWHASAWGGAGFYVCGPVRWVKPDAPPRMCGDGPTVSTEDILVARTSVAHKRHPGSRPGHYLHGTDSRQGKGKRFPGSKPLGLMRAIVADYTLPGDLVVDCYAGTGTTLRACMELGRRAIGAEMDPTTYQLAYDRLRGLGPREVGGQGNLFVGADR